MKWIDRYRRFPADGDASWRGTSGEQADQITAAAAKLLEKRSRKLLAELIRPHRKRLFWSIFWVIVTIVSGLVTPFLISLAIDKGIRPFVKPGGTDVFPRELLNILIIFLGTVTINALAERWFALSSGRLTQDVLHALRMKVFKKFQSLSLAFHGNYTSGRVIARMTSDIDALSELLGSGINQVVIGVLELTGILIMCFVLDVPLAAMLLVLIPATHYIAKWFRNSARNTYRRQRRAVALVIVHVVESLGGMRAVQAFRRERRNDQIMLDVNTEYTDSTVESIRLLSIFAPGLAFLGRLAAAAVLLVGGYRVGGDAMTLGALTAFLIYVRRFFEPLQELSQVFNLFQAASAALDNLAGVLDEETTVPEPLRPKTIEHPRGRVTMEGVSFGYREVEVLHGIDLEVPAGQTVALVGETGAGKTTLARLVSRAWDPRDGRVSLDGVDLRDLTDEELRRHVAMVTQESYLFSGKVSDNIALGKPDATRQEIIEATEAIGARGFIEALPEGFDTDVHRRGGRLSAGQRQLVSFARAFLADPRVLILDEATSSLDIPSERAVQRAMKSLLADRTAFIIAHRLTTVEIADRVLVVSAGRIVEDGAPADLIAEGGAYAGLHTQWGESLAR